MIRKLMTLAVCLFAFAFTNQVARAADPAKTETVTVVIKDLLGFDGDFTVKPEGGGKALYITGAANNKTFTAAKMNKIHKAKEDRTPIKFLVKGDVIVDVLE